MKNIKLPTILGIIILSAGLFAGVLLINSRQVFKLGAKVEPIPKDIRITNITESSFTVSWTTEVESRGFVKWGKKDKLFNQTAREETAKAGLIHSTTIISLDSDGTYYFNINSNGKDYDNEGISWSVKTLSQKPNQDKIYVGSGIVLQQDGMTKALALIYLTINGVVQSTITSEQGSWVIPITNYTQNVNDQTVVEIFVNAGTVGTASAIINAGNVKNTPTIILGKVNDFRNMGSIDNSTNLPESSLNLPEDVEIASRFEVEEQIIEENDKKEDIPVSLDSIDEGETITTVNPEFFGKGPTEAMIEIVVESDPQTDIVATDESGNWSWNPPNNLEEGEHSVTIKWQDASGIFKTITRNFYVSAAEGPAFEASQSAEIVEITSTPKPTVKPVATTQPVPETGVLTPTLGLFIVGIVMLLGSTYFWKKAYAEV